MAYKIQYSPENTARYPQISKMKGFPFKGLMMFVLLLAVVVWLQVNGVPDYFIPGDPEVTKTAARMMLADLREGTRVAEAVTVFCKEILYGAGY